MATTAEADKKEIRYLQAKEIRVEGEGSNPKISGYAALYNVMSEDMGFREIILPGAFTKSLGSSPDVRLLIEHCGLPLARTSSGTLKLSEDTKGLVFEAELDGSDPDVQRVVPKLKRGDLSQCSFAFYTISDNWRMQDEQEIRELIEVDINNGDVSVVTYPAYADTSVSLAMRSRDAWKQSQEPARTPEPTANPEPPTVRSHSDEELKREAGIMGFLSKTL